MKNERKLTLGESDPKGARHYCLLLKPPHRGLQIGALLAARLNMGDLESDDPGYLNKKVNQKVIEALGDAEFYDKMVSILLGDLFAGVSGTQGQKINSLSDFDHWFKEFPQDFLPLSLFVCSQYLAFFMGGDLT